jgi:hypothetical protein
VGILGERQPCAFSRPDPHEIIDDFFTNSLNCMAGSLREVVAAARAAFLGIALIAELIALRHQVAALRRSGTRRPCFRVPDGLFWVLLSRWWSGWRETLLDLVEEPLHEVARTVEVGTEADRVFAILLRWNVGPSALLFDERPNPVGIVATIRQQHRSRP